jgi:hemerythrin-like domain-containing protein
MEVLTQPLREEHQELRPQIEMLREVADKIDTMPISTLKQSVSEASMFLEHHLIPHAQAEEKVLYPAVGRCMNAPMATATMSRDHVEIVRLTEELAVWMERNAGTSISTSQENDLRSMLYGLYAIIKLHLAKEEEVYLPLLDTRLSSDEARDMFEKMEAAAGEAKSKIHS